ncbi:rho guanine nucleotide exchange factor 16, partial [Clupea harengus]|uniref:Rho guanine nucleotide exchange factor 16 n=1 Tax=Clupea harengus TaxID=7950 RepID=A0A6P8FDW0_CLUHA
MSNRLSDGSVGDKAPIPLEQRFSSDLQLDTHTPPRADLQLDTHTHPGSDLQLDTHTPPGAGSAEDCQDSGGVGRRAVLSPTSKVAKKLGTTLGTTTQLIPKSLAKGRPKARHHTTVVTLPVGLPNALDTHKAKCVSHVPDLSWEDYDSDGDGFALRSNRRNKSYRAAVTSLSADFMAMERTGLRPLGKERERAPSPQPSTRTPTRKRTFGRKRNQRHGGSFKDKPRLYQEIRERGLQNTDDDFTQVEPPPEDQGIVVKNFRPAQLTWSQLPQVKDTGILELISPEERKRQEAIFEILTSEYSYQHSLSILVRCFKESQELRSTMTTTEHHHLFSNISVIQTVNKRFFEDLEKRHTIHPVIQDISDIVQSHATHHFQPYIVYCSNETFQQRTLQKLLLSNSAFKEALKRIEGSSECGGLPMISFLILPMQRVTRLPLLMDTICQKTPAETAEYFAAFWAFKAISKLVKSCNDGARTMERTEEMYTIQKQMDFSKIKPFPLVSSSRGLVKSGELAVCTEELSLFWKPFSHRSYFLFLFNDVLIITKKKSEEMFVVLDYATLEHVCVEEESVGGANPLQLRVVMDQNSDGHREQIGLVAESKLDKARWVTALREHRRAESDTNRDGWWSHVYHVSLLYHGCPHD